MRSKIEAFTLVEVVVALALICAAVAGAYLLIVHAARLTRIARDHYIAINLAKNHLERARNFRFGDLYLLEEAGVLLDENGAPNPDGRFRRITQVEDAEEGLIKLTVIVQIRDRRTGQFAGQEERVSSLFTEYLEAPTP